MPIKCPKCQFDNPDNPRFCGKGKHDLAHIEVDRAISLDPILYRNFWAKGDIYNSQGDLVNTEKEYEKLLELEEIEIAI